MRRRGPFPTSFFVPVPVRFALLLLAVALAAGRAAADDWPVLRAGMWEFNRTIETPGTPGKPQTIQKKDCTNPTEDMKKQNEMLTKAGCKFSPVVRSGNTYTTSSSCTMQGVSSTGKSVLTVQSDSAYEIRVDSDFGGKKTHEVLRAKRTGDCPR